MEDVDVGYVAKFWIVDELKEDKWNVYIYDVE